MSKIASGSQRLIQRQATRVNGWTQARRRTFLMTLAETSNVAMAVAAAEMSTSGAYRLRQRDPAFAALWETALEEGYRHLEGELLAQARGQVVVDEDNPDPAALSPVARPERRIDPALALKMLQMRDARMKAGMTPQMQFVRRSQEEIDAALMKLCKGLAKADPALLTGPAGRASEMAASEMAASALAGSGSMGTDDPA